MFFNSPENKKVIEPLHKGNFQQLFVVFIVFLGFGQWRQSTSYITEKKPPRANWKCAYSFLG